MASELAAERELQALAMLGAFLRYVDATPGRFPALASRVREEGVFARLALHEARAAFNARPQILDDYVEFERALRAIPADAAPQPLRVDWPDSQVMQLMSLLDRSGMQALSTMLRELAQPVSRRTVGISQ